MAALLERGEYKMYTCRLAHMAGLFIAMGEAIAENLLTNEECEEIGITWG
jgi:hypothetical protein